MKKRRNSKKHLMPSKLQRFYKSDLWHMARAQVILRAKGRCEKCGSVGTEVHHKIHLNIQNVDDVSVSINPENLMLLCKDCHNKEHHRFGKRTSYAFDEEGNLVHSNNK